MSTRTTTVHTFKRARLNPGTAQAPLHGDALDGYLQLVDHFLVAAVENESAKDTMLREAGRLMLDLHARPANEDQYRHLLENTIALGLEGEDGKDWSQLRAHALSRYLPESRPLMEAKLLAHRCVSASRVGNSERAEALGHLEQMKVIEDTGFGRYEVFTHWMQLGEVLQLTRSGDAMPTNRPGEHYVQHARFLALMNRHIGAHYNTNPRTLEVWHALATGTLHAQAGDLVQARLQTERLGRAMTALQNGDSLDMCPKFWFLYSWLVDSVEEVAESIYIY